MATFDIENNVFIKALTLNSQSSVLAISTAGKFVNRNISVQITAKTGSARTPATSITQNPEITLTTATGAIQANYTKTQSVTPSVTEGWVNTGTSGMITTMGSTSITLPASTATVTDNSITIQPGWFGATTALTVTSGSASTPATTIAKAPTISVATATGVVTAKYNSSQSITPTVVAGWVSSGTAGTVSTTGNATLTLPTAGVSLSGNTFSLTPGWIKSTTSLSVTTVSVTANNASVSGSNFYQAFLSVPTGYVSATTAARASFANSGSSGTSYLDISNTTGAPILVSGDFLYINKGYTDNVKISLAKLVPNEASVLLADSHILTGYAAYNNNGILVAGSIPIKSNTDITESLGILTVPSGYYGTTANIALDAGEYNAGVTLSSVTVTPSVSITNASTYGFTTTEPLNGTYITINPSANTPSYSATGSANIITAGYINTGSQYNSATATVSVAEGDNYYIPIVTPTFSGGALTVNTNSNTLSTTPVVTLSATGTLLTIGTATYGVTFTKPSGDDGTNYLSIDGNGIVSTTGIAISSVKMTSSTVTYSNTAGVIASHANVVAYAGVNTTTGTSVNITPTITDNFDTLYVPIVTPKITLKANSYRFTIDCSATPSVTLSTSGTFFTNTATYGITTTKPSGTDGTTYLTLDGNGIVSTTGIFEFYSGYTATATYFDNYSGLVKLEQGAGVSARILTEGHSTAVNVIPTITDNFATHYMPIVSTTFSGGTLNVSSTNAITTNMATTSTSSYYIDAVATITATRAQVNYNNAAGAIAAHSGATAIAVSRSNTSTSATRIYIPKATFKGQVFNNIDITLSKTANNVIINGQDNYNNNIAIIYSGHKPTMQITGEALTSGYIEAGNISQLANVINFSSATATYYLQGVTINKPASGEAKFSITVPNGEDDDMITFVFHVDPSGNVVVDNSTANAFS